MRKKPGILERTRAYLSWLASRYILYEDVKIFQQIQQGREISPSGNELNHEEEKGVAHFHTELQEWLRAPADSQI